MRNETANFSWHSTLPRFSCRLVFAPSSLVDRSGQKIKEYINFLVVDFEFASSGQKKVPLSPCCQGYELSVKRTSGAETSGKNRHDHPATKRKEHHYFVV